MAVDLFSLNVKLGATGTGAVLSDLRSIDAQGVKTAASLNGISGSLDRQASAALNGTKGFKDLSAAYANQDRVLATNVAATTTATKAMAEGTEAAKAKTSALATLGGALGRLAIAYVGFKGIEFVKHTLDAAGALHELSQRTGASVETLSVLQFAGAQAGVSTEQVATAFKGMALSLGNLRDGQEKTVAAYQRLGFTTESFKGLSPEQTFIKLATAVGGMKDETERAEVAQRVFGRSGATLLPLLEDIATKGFGAIRAETEKNGGLFTTEMANKADAFTDALTRLSGSFRVLMVEVLTPLLPLLTKFVDGLTNAARLLKETGIGGWTAALMAGGLQATAPHGADPGGFRGDNLGMGTNPLEALGPISTDPEKAKSTVKAKVESAEARVRRLLAVLDAVAPSSLPGGGAISGESNLALRGGGVGALSPAAIGGGADEFAGGSLTGDLSSIFAQGGSGKSPEGRMAILQAFANEAKRQAIALQVQFATLGQNLGMTLADGFSAAISGALHGKNAFKSFGNAVLQGLGSIFSQMGKSMLTAGLALTKLLPFMSNPITGGPALIAAGIILTGVGAALGAIATGPGGGSGGGGGGGDFKDRTTQITLTANGMGGFTAPQREAGPTIRVFGKDDPEGQRIFGEHYKSAARSRNV